MGIDRTKGGSRGGQVGRIDVRAAGPGTITAPSGTTDTASARRPGLPARTASHNVRTSTNGWMN